MTRFGIVGGGMLGMTLAWDLAKAGHDVTIFEAARAAAAWPRRGNSATSSGTVTIT